jgi:hypothetical protein
LIINIIFFLNNAVPEKFKWSPSLGALKDGSGLLLCKNERYKLQHNRDLLLHNLLNSEFTLLSFLSESLKSTKRGSKEVKIILASVLLLIL